MPRQERIFLIGPMGAGKTSVGKRLARKLSWDFIDTDAEIEKLTGVDIAFIFEKEGEEGFRLREKKLLDDLTQKSRIILATGGGAIILPDNRKHLGTRGMVIYLQTSVEQQLMRTNRSNHRPLLDTNDKQARLEQMATIRNPLYESIADIIIITNGRQSSEVAQELYFQFSPKD